MRLEAFDIETAGDQDLYALQPFRAALSPPQGRITSYATAWREDGETLSDGDLWPTVDRLRRFLTRCAATGTYVVGWNTPFDVAWLIAIGLCEEVMKVKWLDAMLLYKHLTSSPLYLPEDDKIGPKSYGLKQAVKDFYPAEAGYDDGIVFAPEPDDYMAWERLLDYNKLDCVHTLNLAYKFISKLTASQLQAALIEAECIPLIADAMVRGIRTDPEAAKVLSDKLSDDAALAYCTLLLTDPEHISEELLASPVRLRDLMFNKWRLPVISVTDGGAPSTDKEALAELAAIDPRAKLVRDYREAMNNRTKFAEAIGKSTDYNGDGFTRPGPRIFGTYTGRLTYASKQGKGVGAQPVGVALHQWKRGKDFRNLLRAPEGYTLLEHDAAGQEFRWMAVESGDEAMLRLCEPGEDAHAYMASRINGGNYKDIQRAAAHGDASAKEIRQLGKLANLSCQYRTSHKRLRVVAVTQYGVALREYEAKAIWSTYRTTYIGVPEYWKRQIAFAQHNGYVETLAGRRVHLARGIWHRDSSWSLEGTAINSPIQGVGADQKYLALKVLKDYLPSVEGAFYYELHDGLFTIVPDRYAERAALEIKDLLSNLPYKQAWGKTFPIQFPFDAKLGKAWGSLKEIS